ncbi:MAG TPA: glycoside hydrolase family 15 protein [Streptosporangiaceae bacterium]|nr:glycoside hydrolase family 15 protein [Streptosporangiaceae bacterium]
MAAAQAADERCLWRPRVLREYSFIADGERGALVAPDGAMVWLCAPAWDSPPVFAALLGGRGGYQLTPSDPWYVWGGAYESGSLIWRARWVGAETFECREALAMPADPHRAVILRRIEAHDGPARVDLVLELGTPRRRVQGLKRSKGAWTGQAGSLRFRWTGVRRARKDADGRLVAKVTVPAGTHHDLVLEISDRPLPGGTPDAGLAWEATEDAWRAADVDCAGLVASRDARHSYAVLTGLTSRSGAMVAAATTSLPERLGGVRNYDYRYAWIRDQCYAGLAVAAHGNHGKLTGMTRFVTERLLDDGPDLAPAYTASGGRLPEERRLRLRGYPGSRPRAGNKVRAQFQLDSLGEALQLLAAAGTHDLLGSDDWRAAEVAACAIEKRWRQPDAGIWELTDELWTHSRLTCVSGLRAIAGVAPRAGAQASRWTGLADSIMASLDASVHRTGRWQRTPSDARVDAALLLPVVRGAVPIGDPRGQATVEAIKDELTDDGFVYRYRDESRPGRAEGAFLLCGFWMALSAHVRGDDVEAAHWFERSRSACGPAALYTEEYDPLQRQQRGNLPQAFVHAAMLECAVRLSAAANVNL